jgi:secreted trypsin-like serine protease
MYAFGQSKVVGGTPSPVLFDLPVRQQDAIVAFVGGNGRPFCTGTAIAPHVVLSAAHCNIRPGTRVRIGQNTLAPAAEARVAEVVRHPGWRQLVHDHALVLLDRELPVTPIPVGSRVPSEVQNVGYGWTSAGTEGNTERWWVAEPVVAQEASYFVVDGAGRHGLCQGDSGGPALAPGPTVVGTVSQGAVSCVGQDSYSRPDPAWVRAGLAAWPEPGKAPVDWMRYAWIGAAVLGVVVVAGVVLR